MTIEINGEPLEVEYEKTPTGEIFTHTIPGPRPQITVKTEQFNETLTAKGMTFEFTRKIVTTGTNSRETYELDGNSFESIEAFVTHLLTT